MADSEPPRLVVTNTNAELERQRAEQERKQADRDREWAERDVNGALRQLAANLIRVVRGAGKPYDIADHAQRFIEALVKYRDATGHLAVMNQFPVMLSFQRDAEFMARFEGAHLQELYGEEEIIRGALQVAASRLLGQTTQQAAGGYEMGDGIRRRQEARAEKDREWDRMAREREKAARETKPKRGRPAMPRKSTRTSV